MPGRIETNSILTGDIVTLVPMEEQHIPLLVDIAKDKRIWEFYAYDGADEKVMQRILQSSFAEKQTGSRFPFVIVHNPTNTLIGSTSLMDIQAQHKKLEIGSTWLVPAFWATAVNAECKLLLLRFCFEKLGCLRVQFKTDEKNMRSRKAIQKIGGSFEGILRNDMLRENGTLRHSAYFSIIEEEWPEKKQALEALLQAKVLQDQQANPAHQINLHPPV